MFTRNLMFKEPIGDDESGSEEEDIIFPPARTPKTRRNRILDDRSVEHTVSICMQPTLLLFVNPSILS